MGTGVGRPEETTANYYDNYHLAIPFFKLIEKGEIDEKVLDDKARRVLRLILRTAMNQDKPFGSKNNKEHLETAQKIAEEGIVLLKNDNDFFPVEDKKGITIAVIGENAMKPMTVGGGSSELKARFEISPLEGLKKRYKNADIKYSMGYSTGGWDWKRVLPPTLDQDSLREEAVKLASEADVVLFIGGLNKNLHQDCEGDDRLRYGLPFGQPELLNELLKVNKNLGIILISGNAVEMPRVDDVNGIMQAWYLGSMTGTALASVVSGDANPSGKLPFSFPVKLEDNGAISFGAESYPGDSINEYYKEGILVGYRWLDTKKIKPLFAFGHGLSYTTFELSNIKTDKKKYLTGDVIKVTCELSNTGDVEGAEVIQVYVGKKNSKVERPLKELKGFTKTVLKKGETKNIEITVDTDDLAYYDETAGEWKVEKGDYTVYVGTASDKIDKKLKIEVE
jgi:beta-glucosidase